MHYISFYYVIRKKVRNWNHSVGRSFQDIFLSLRFIFCGLLHNTVLLNLFFQCKFILLMIRFDFYFFSTFNLFNYNLLLKQKGLFRIVLFSVIWYGTQHIISKPLDKRKGRSAIDSQNSEETSLMVLEIQSIGEDAWRSIDQIKILNRHV